MTREKEFKPVNKQLDILVEDRELIKIKDRDKAEKTLLSYNYFNIINGFETLLLEEKESSSDKRFKNKKFSDFERCFYLDREIAKHLFGEIEKIELEIKTKLAYYFCEKYCARGLAENLNYQEISYYTIPVSGSAPDKYINYFYNTRTNNRTSAIEIIDKTTHTILRRHNYYKANVKNIQFDGNITSDSNDSSSFYLKGKFVGLINNSKNNVYEGTLKVKSSENPHITLAQGDYTNYSLSNCTGDFLKLSYSDFCKLKYKHISSYEKPPLWVVINTLMFNDLIILFLGMNSDIQQKLYENMGDFDRSRNGLEKFVNTLEILNDLRNHIAHFGMSTRYRTNSNLSINTALKRDLSLNPKTTNKIICFSDTIKVCSNFNNFSDKEIQKKIFLFKIKNILLGKRQINKRFDRRVGKS